MKENVITIILLVLYEVKKWQNFHRVNFKEAAKPNKYIPILNSFEKLTHIKVSFLLK